MDQAEETKNEKTNIQSSEIIEVVKRSALSERNDGEAKKSNSKKTNSVSQFKKQELLGGPDMNSDPAES